MTKIYDYGTITYDDKEYHLQNIAQPTSRLLPDHLKGCFEMTALAIGEDNQAYEIRWLFEDDGRELDEYDYDDVYDVQSADVPVYLVQMIRGTEDVWDETHDNPETILRTLILKGAQALRDSTSAVELDTCNLDGSPYFLAPAIIQVWGKAAEILY